MILVQWNIQWCRGLDGKVDPQRIVETAKSFGDFDVLCLQEVAVNFPALAGSLGEDQPFALGKWLPQHEPVFAAATDVPGGHESRRRFGNMIFSRFPVQQVYRHTLPWPAPTVFLMRHGGTGTYTLRLAEDVYPNQPNVRRYHVALDAALFKDPRFEVTDIGPFVLAIRKPTSDGH